MVLTAERKAPESGSLKKKKSYVKGQVNFAVCLSSNTTGVPGSHAARGAEEESSFRAGHRERLFAAPSIAQQVISVFQDQYVVIDFPLTYRCKRGIIPSQLM